LQLFKLKRPTQEDYYIIGMRGIMHSPITKKIDTIFNGDREMYAFGEVINNEFKIIRRLTTEEVEKI
jgi:hypothetical protein